MTSGQLIRAARKKAGMTQAELAQKLGISYVGVSQWENDLRNPKLETLQKIALALGVDPSSLISRETASAYACADIKERTRLKRIEKAFRQMNDEGQEKAVQRVEELAEVPRLQKTDVLQE